RSRLAAANSKSVLVLALLVVVIAGYWGFRFFASDDALPADMPSVYELYCTKCVEVIKVPRAEARGRPRDENRKVLCPKCGTYSGNWGNAPVESGGVMPP
ncbi:MAG: hypothetical protein IID33_07700, partial [Planctomycetes bacterium]|nr:hypothetical protein [Planctomycetota bacterium]